MDKWLLSRARKRNRTKGHDFERECANRLKYIFPKVKRHLEYQSAEATGVDLDGTYPYAFQCKKTKRYVSVSTIKEIKVNSLFGETPVLITAQEGSETMAVLPFKALIELIAIAEGKKK